MTKGYQPCVDWILRIVLNYQEVCKWLKYKTVKVWSIQAQTDKIVKHKVYLFRRDGILCAVTLDGKTYKGEGVEFFLNKVDAKLWVVKKNLVSLDDLKAQLRDLESKLQS